MELLILIVLIIAVIAGEAFLDNFWWIGGLAILYLVFSVIRQIAEDKSDIILDGGEFVILLMKLGAIAGIVWFIWFI